MCQKCGAIECVVLAINPGWDLRALSWALQGRLRRKHDHSLWSTAFGDLLEVEAKLCQHHFHNPIPASGAIICQRCDAIGGLDSPQAKSESEYPLLGNVGSWVELDSWSFILVNNCCRLGIKNRATLWQHYHGNSIHMSHDIMHCWGGRASNWSSQIWVWGPSSEHWKASWGGSMIIHWGPQLL